jgi:hypothetical protein
MIETAIDPRHPSRFEKKANTLQVPSWFTADVAVPECVERKICFGEANRSR